MKLRNIFFSVIGAAVLASASSCSKYDEFGDTNVNPGGVETPTPAFLFANGSYSIPTIATTEMVRPGYYAQYFAETQYSDASLYSVPQLSFTGYYSGVLNDLQNLIGINSSNNLTQASRILQSYIFWTITDRWGDVPYSEALKGMDLKLPVYDNQEDIYKGILETLADAGSAFDATSTIDGDISSFKGDVAKWKKLANSLRVLVSLQMSKRYAGASDFAATQLKAALSDAAGVIEENDDNYSFAFPGGTFANPWYGLYNGRKDQGESKTMTDLMTTLTDGRQAAYGSTVDGAASSNGVPYGWVRSKVDPWAQANADWTYILRTNLRQDNSTVVALPAAVVTLARAEAADRGWTSEVAWDLLQKGVNLSFSQWGVNAPPASYFTNSNVVFSVPAGTGGNLRKIAVQEYIAAYPNGLMGWNIWRRTGYPVLTPAEDAVNDDAGKTIPRRYTYASSEYSSNKVNVEAAVTRLNNGDKMNSNIWWDQ